MKRDRLPLFFMHVPKCAGISVYQFLRGSFDESQVCPTPADGTWRWHGPDVPGYALYWGHFTSDFLNEMGPGGTRLIMLRRAEQRVISLYDFWRAHRWSYIENTFPPSPPNGPALAKSSDFNAFLESPYVFHNISNQAARQLVGERFEALWPNEDAVKAAALKSLGTFDWVGLTESFEKSVQQLGTTLGIRVPKALPRENSTYDVPEDDPAFERVTRTEPTEAQRQRILQLNRVDEALYAEGLRRHDRQTRPRGPLQSLLGRRSRS